MDHNVKADTVNYDAYKSAKASRPAWATALIVAAVILIAGIAMSLMSGLAVGWTFFVASGITALIAGVLALVGIRKA